MLKIENISKNLEGFSIKNLNFSVDTGDYFVLLGVSGAGKSLILELIAGLINPDSGNIILDSKDITNDRIQKRQIGLVFQDYAVFPHLSVKENIAYPLHGKNLDSSELHQRVEQLAEEMNISHLLHRKPDTLSGGELQRVALARTLALKPKLLLLDEPLASLDVQLRNELRGLLRKINRNGQTIIHVTHDYEEAISLANRIAIIHDGTIIQTGNPKEVFQHPKSQFAANLTGIKNFFKVKINEDGKGKNKAFINDTIPISILTDEAEGDGYILIRSEDIIISGKKLESSATNNFKGVVIDIIPAKLGVEVFVEIGIKLSVLITKESSEKFNLSEGKNIWVSFKASAVKFLKN
ncbi:MAG: ABC transporter ATP-binding protein [Bacteroidota bacterium]